MQDLKQLSEIELIKKIFNCDKEIVSLLAIQIEHYPGAIMGLGDFYVEKYILMTELYNRRQSR